MLKCVFFLDLFDLNEHSVLYIYLNFLRKVTLQKKYRTISKLPPCKLRCLTLDSHFLMFFLSVFFCVLVISIENFILGGVIIANSTNVRSAQKLKCGLVLAINYIGTPPIKLAIFYIKIIQCECSSDSLLVLLSDVHSTKLILYWNVKKFYY